LKRCLTISCGTNHYPNVDGSREKKLSNFHRISKKSFILRVESSKMNGK
jgi:hypothetical protein